MSYGLGRFVGDVPAPRPPPPEQCEMCGASIPVAHGHVVDLEHRSLMCGCRPCYLLFVRGAGRYRAVPDRVLAGPGLSSAEWDELQIPVGVVFVLNGQAFYPSPAGATECQLDLSAWDRLAAAHPLLAAASPDVEAILLRRDEGECLLVPIDSCYELVGLVRSTWLGFDGGEEARTAISGFFERLRTRAV